MSDFWHAIQEILECKKIRPPIELLFFTKSKTNESRFINTKSEELAFEKFLIKYMACRGREADMYTMEENGSGESVMFDNSF